LIPVYYETNQPQKELIITIVTFKPKILFKEKRNIGTIKYA